MNSLKILLIILSIAASQFSYAGDKYVDRPNPFLIAAIIEGGLVANALLASQNPQLYGVAGVLIFPFHLVMSDGAAEDSGMAKALVVGAESIAIYNITLDEDKYSEGEIFRNNLIGWHIFLGVGAAYYYLRGERRSPDKMSMSFVPSVDGGRIQFGFRF